MNKDSLGELDLTAPVSEQASHWWHILNSGPATDAEHRAFGEWAARSPERVEAFLQTARLVKALKSKNLRWPDSSLEELVQQAIQGGDVISISPVRPIKVISPNSQPLSMPGRFLKIVFNHASELVRARPKMWLIAPMTIAAFGIVLGISSLLDGPTQYRTAIGEQRSVVLGDGSVVSLNTASKIDVKLEKNHRTVHLMVGEALFQVAHDPARPFDVIVDNTRVRAVGTQFNVNKGTNGTTVTVVEGKVLVDSNFESVSKAGKEDQSPGVAIAPVKGGDSAKGIHWNTPKPATGTVAKDHIALLGAGEQLTIGEVTPTESLPQHADVFTATAWTHRRLVFEHRSLGEVTEEFNRYNVQSIEIGSPRLRAQEVTGVFQANDTQSFLEFVSKIPGVKIERAEGKVVVLEEP